MRYAIIIEERSSGIPLILPPTSTYKDAQYWAERAVKLGSKQVTIWEGNNIVKWLMPKETE